MKIIIKTTLFLIFTQLLTSCSPEGYMRTWSSNKEFDNQFSSLMVLGMINDVILRNDIENEVVFAAKKNNLKATNGMSMFPPEMGKPFEDVEKFKSKLRDKGFDGILTIALIDIKEERYIAPEMDYQPFGYYDRFRNYYFRTYDLVYRPGYFRQTSKYFIETNFYELKTGGLVWSGRSMLFSPSEIDAFTLRYSKNLFKELIKEGIIKN